MMNRSTVLAFVLLSFAYGIQCATLTQSISAAINTSMTKINATLVTMSTTFANGEKSALASLITLVTTVNQTLVPLLTKYNSYGVDTSKVATIITGLSEQLANAKEILGTFDAKNVDKAFAYAVGLVQNINATLNTAANQMTASAVYGGKYNATCLNKYGAMLYASPVSADRINTCIQNEVTPITNLATNITTLFSIAQPVAIQMFNMINVCSTSPNSACIQEFFQKIGLFSWVANFPLSFIGYVNPLSQSITYRLNRCASLTTVDIGVLVETYTNNFSKCLSTGS
ncbi:uncharacterized protein LOC131678290 [Topomyia yanbarensis]|uniref:uncharacterized protein LOC131678290 n=1 Tax=Topomyia yanbarensis TaxID=2498891 RepID=UPI00273C6F79|nr:uncharacterized protein LOC131678290 [Topomyia yanbarensis]